MLRRKILKLLCAAPLGSLIPTPFSSTLVRAPQDVQLESLLRELLGGSEEAQRLGALYRKDHHFDKQSFLRSLLPAFGVGPESLLEELLSRMNQDFEGDNLAVIEGWVLSKTEAELCASL